MSRYTYLTHILFNIHMNNFRVLIQEKLFLSILGSFVFFWYFAVFGEISVATISKLIVGLMINIPLFLIASDRLRTVMSRGAGYRYGILFPYVVLFCLVYSITITLTNYSDYFYLKTFVFYLTYHLWQPLCILIIAYAVLGRRNESELSNRIFIFLLIALCFQKITNGWISDYFLSYASDKLSYLDSFYRDIALFRIPYSVKARAFTFYNFIGICLPILIVLCSSISWKQIGFRNDLHKNFWFVFGCLAVVVLHRFLPIFLSTHEFVSEKIVVKFLTTFYFAVRASIFEEILFRGFFQTYFFNKLGPERRGAWIAILATSVLFGLYHYPFAGISFTQSFVYGVFFGWIYHRTGNLWAPILIHGFGNYLSIVMYW